MAKYTLLIKKEEEAKQQEEVKQKEVPHKDSGEVDVDFLMDIPLDLSVEIGRKTMLVKHLLNVNKDSILELDKQIGQPLNILINNKLVARGEVVVQNEKFGLKVTEVVDSQRKLGVIKS